MFRLTNQRDPEKTLAMTSETWYGILDLVEMYGWLPLGTVFLERWEDLEIGLGWDHSEAGPRFYEEGLDHDSRVVEESRLVVVEEALNLADALERAFLDYEPMHVPASFFLFSLGDTHVELRPSIGAISLLIELCRAGAFWVERVARCPTRPGERA